MLRRDKGKITEKKRERIKHHSGKKLVGEWECVQESTMGKRYTERNLFWSLLWHSGC